MRGWWLIVRDRGAIRRVWGSWGRVGEDLAGRVRKKGRIADRVAGEEVW